MKKGEGVPFDECSYEYHERVKGAILAHPRSPQLIFNPLTFSVTPIIHQKVKAACRELINTSKAR